jgi:hypothetical protein
VVWVYSVNKQRSKKNTQSIVEAVAKHLKEFGELHKELTAPVPAEPPTLPSASQSKDPQPTRSKLSPSSRHPFRNKEGNDDHNDRWLVPSERLFAGLKRIPLFAHFPFFLRCSLPVSCLNSRAYSAALWQQTCMTKRCPADCTVCPYSSPRTNFRTTALPADVLHIGPR